MANKDTRSQFSARLLRPKKPADGEEWPRRGRTSVDGTLNGKGFKALLLEPDGQKSHWLRIDPKLQRAAKATPGDVAELEITPVAQEPEPEVPEDLREALKTSPEALATWEATTTLARVDWIHWVVTAKQAKTRQADQRRLGQAGVRRKAGVLFRSVRVLQQGPESAGGRGVTAAGHVPVVRIAAL